MAYTTFGGAESGEVLMTAERVDDGDIEGWHTEWYRTAERSTRSADEAIREGHPRTARSAYFRSHNYRDSQ